ncbi:putative signal transducing protein [Vallitalea guaymasensis]|uniref:putative signal transducing protein n=1 Tax=Vallitalea guaymasensis TaxID=1185412 RepID=UPI000DE3BF43|nr:DUF2007 domain-containing protein [Vallitalea guaymasensis]
MAWCPKCKSEYEDNVKVCKECNVELVDQLENDEVEYQNFEFLINVGTVNEANILISLLESYDIPTIHKSKGSGEYLQVATGINYQGVDIYVPADVLTKAKEIIDYSNNVDLDDDTQTENIIEENNNFEDEELHQLDKKNSSKRRTRLLILILLFIVLPLLIVIISWFI